MSACLDWVTPNDPAFRPGPAEPCQWGHFLIDVPKAWEFHKGSPEVVVAVADDGIQTDHPDLVNRIWTNSHPGTAGYPGDVHGWDFRDNDATVDDHGCAEGLLGSRGHGTHVAGIIAAEANNGIGIAGIAPGCQILPIRLNAYDDHQMAQAIRYALAYGARVFNCNGAYHPARKVRNEPGFEEFFVPPSSELLEACQEAYARGMLLVFPTGGNRGPRNTVTYPACYPQVINVAPCNAAGEPSNFAPFGPTVEVLAPGGQRRDGAAGASTDGVYSLDDGGAYAYRSGGCTATPHVSGVLALILSQNPHWTCDEARMILRNTAGGAGWSPRTGHGLLNAGRALQVRRVEIDLRIASVAARRAGPRGVVRQDVARLPYERPPPLDGYPTSIQAVIRNDGVRDLPRGLALFYAGAPERGGQMIAARDFRLNGLESVCLSIETGVAEDCREIHVLADPLGAPPSAGRPYCQARCEVSGR